MKGSQTPETYMWVLPWDVLMTLGVSTRMEGLPSSTGRRSLIKLPALAFYWLSPTPFMGREDAKQGKSQAKKPSQGNHHWNECKVHNEMHSENGKHRKRWGRGGGHLN